MLKFISSLNQIDHKIKYFKTSYVEVYQNPLGDQLSEG